MSQHHMQIEDLNVWYGSQHALKGISAQIPARGITAIIGPSGCGKTTLLRSLNRLIEETPGVRVAGQVWLAGQDIYGRSLDVTDVRTRVGMLAPKPFPPASGLSTGQQQRLCLARALAVEPEVLLCDEPTSALDPISAQGVEEQLQALRAQTTIVVVTHILRQARRLADHIIFLWMGELVEAGPAEQVFASPRDERTRHYLAGDIG
jgi:phosphate transport system ATP-binding protein